MNHISHLGVILLLLLAFPFENCFETHNILPGKELAVNRPKITNKTTDNELQQINEELDTNNPSVEPKNQQIIIHPDATTQDPSSSRIPSYTSTTSTSDYTSTTSSYRGPNLLGDQETPILSSNNIPKDIVSTTPSLNFTQEQPVFKPNISYLRYEQAREEGEVEKFHDRDNLLNLSNQLLGKVFKTEGGNTVEFYKEQGVFWWAKVKLRDKYKDKNKLFLPAYLDETSIMWLVDAVKFRPNTVRRIDVVLPTLTQRGYVSTSIGPAGMMQGEEEKTEKGKEKEKEEAEKGKDKAHQLYTEAEKAYKYFEAKELKRVAEASKSLESSIRLYKQAADLGHEEAQKKLGSLKEIVYKSANRLYAKRNMSGGSHLAGAIQLYKQAAYLGHEKAQEKLIALRSQTAYKKLLINSNKNIIKEYNDAVGMDRTITFNEFIIRAKDRPANLANEIAKDRKKGKRVPEQLKAMRISDLIVMNLDSLQVPVRVEWGGNYTDPKLANAKDLFGPLFDMPFTEEYEDSVLTVDPSSTGDDETGYCVAKRYKDYYFILDVGGFGGGYREGKAKNGHTNKIVDELTKIAIQYKVNTIFIETNADPSLEYRFKKSLLEKGLGTIRVIGKSENQNKQKRIVDILGPLLENHQIIISETALQSDFKSAPQENGLDYKFFYQLMAIESTSKNTTTGIFQNNPKHDDRVDAVATAIGYLKDERTILKKIEMLLKELEDMTSSQNTTQQSPDKKDASSPSEGKQVKATPNNRPSPSVNKQTPPFKTTAKNTTLNRPSPSGSRQVSPHNKTTPNNRPSPSGSRQISPYNKTTLNNRPSPSGNKQDSLKEVKKVVSSKAKPVSSKPIKTIIDKKYELANLYKQIGTPEKRQQALDIYQEIQAYHIGARFKLAKLYHKSGVPEQQAEAVRLYNSILSEHPEARRTKYRLAKLYQDGIEGKERFLRGKNENRAFQYYREIEGEHIGAKYELAKIYQNALAGQVKDQEQAFDLYKQAHDKGYAPATYQLARMYETGIEEEKFKLGKDITKALELYRKAAKRRHIVKNVGKKRHINKNVVKSGYTEAQVRLGDLYFQKGPNQSYKKALKWYLEAANQGNSAAQYYLAKMCQNGQVIDKQDDALIFLWYKAAAKQGHVEAQYELGKLYKKEKKYVKASIWFNKSRTMKAQFALCMMDKQKLGNLDNETAIKCFNEALDQDTQGLLDSLGLKGLSLQDEDGQSKFFDKLEELIDIIQKYKQVN